MTKWSALKAGDEIGLHDRRFDFYEIGDVESITPSGRINVKPRGSAQVIQFVISGAERGGDRELCKADAWVFDRVKLQATIRQAKESSLMAVDVLSIMLGGVGLLSERSEVPDVTKMPELRRKLIDRVSGKAVAELQAAAERVWLESNRDA